MDQIFVVFSDYLNFKIRNRQTQMIYVLTIHCTVQAKAGFQKESHATCLVRNMFCHITWNLNDLDRCHLKIITKFHNLKDM